MFIITIAYKSKFLYTKQLHLHCNVIALLNALYCFSRRFVNTLFSQFLLKVLPGQSCIFKRKAFSSLRQTGKSIIKTKASETLHYSSVFFPLLSFLTFIVMWVLISGHRSVSLMPLGCWAGKDGQAEGVGEGCSTGSSHHVPASLAACALPQLQRCPAAFLGASSEGWRVQSIFRTMVSIHLFLKKNFWGIVLLIFLQREMQVLFP